MPRKLTGHIEKRSNSSLLIVINTKPKRTFVSVKTTNMREATKEMYKIIDEIERGIYITPSNMTLGEYLDEWLATKTNLAYNTRRRYKGMIENYFKPDMGDIPLSNLHPKRIQEHYRWLQSTGEGCPGLLERTARKHHNMLHAALKQAVKWGDILRNPTDFVDPPSAESDFEAPILRDKKSILDMLEVVRGSVLYLPALIAVTGGPRVGEVCALRWQDFNMNSGRLAVRHSLHREKGKGLVLGPTKNKRKRSVKLPKYVQDVLRHEYATRYEGREEEDHGDDYICAWLDDGRPLDPQYVSHKFSELDLDVTFHGLRHSHDTLLFNNNVNAKRVAERSGRDVVLTEKIYEHILPDDQDELAGVIQNALFESPESHDEK